MTVEEGFLSWLNHLEHLWVKEKSSVQIPDFSLTGREKTPVSLGASRAACQPAEPDQHQSKAGKGLLGSFQLGLREAHGNISLHFDPELRKAAPRQLCYQCQLHCPALGHLPSAIPADSQTLLGRAET